MRIIKGPSAWRGRGGEGPIELVDVREEEEREGEEKERDREGKCEGEKEVGEECGDLTVSLNNVTVTNHCH